MQLKCSYQSELARDKAMSFEHPMFRRYPFALWHLLEPVVVVFG